MVQAIAMRWLFHFLIGWLNGRYTIRYIFVFMRVCMSEIRRYTITAQMLVEAQKQPTSIQKFFSLLGWEPKENMQAVPTELKKLISLRKIEGLLSATRKNQLFLIILPVVAYLYAQEEAPA